ncbi:DUF6165 family protein [Falsiroseomonas sp. E2-1-a20]|uniref:DUF6165 family protein n=1 Tax=Falsiroseomonas sp. E2-1-a20 TaxID=3239300 RepID=UPI003F3AF7FC
MIPISFGELVDKLTILEIKVERIRNPVQRQHAERERALLQQVLEAAMPTAEAEIGALRQELRALNLVLWDVEDALREKERDSSFDAAFIALARSVYRHNDQRARLKLEVNRRCGSALVEVKSHPGLETAAVNE